ncbi:DNA/RNA non-specific endonuclease [Acetobacter pasteurianus]|uniref:DNA/RNA non-specific endonuclease n=1 Tax=Acetobacter pasteurianus TaxID=438 RepID=UPI003D144F46
MIPASLQQTYRHSSYPESWLPIDSELNTKCNCSASLNEGIWSRVERRVRDMADDEGELYVVTGPAFHLRPIQTMGHDRVYVPSSTWKAVYSPSKNKASAYVCKNAQQHPHCTQVTVATLIRNVGIDPFPAVSAQIKAQAWKLPAP